jgi:cytochrome c556
VPSVLVFPHFSFSGLAQAASAPWWSREEYRKFLKDYLEELERYKKDLEEEIAAVKRELEELGE